MLSGDKPSNKEQHKKIGKALYPPCSWKKQIREYYYKTTYQLIKDQSDELKSNTYQLDVVKE